MMRAEFPRASSPWGEPSAQAALTAGLAPVTVDSLRPHLAARTLFIDGQVEQAIDRGVTQVVILGAGYFRNPGVRFFEVDHPTTQADKRFHL
jgi:O-methyltransferase involved in polyketide biosynthesis